MKWKTASPEYVEKAMALSKEEAERVFARMHGKLARRLENSKIGSLEAVALELQAEDEDLQEWRKRWSDVVDRAEKRGKKGDARG